MIYLKLCSTFMLLYLQITLFSILPPNLLSGIGSSFCLSRFESICTCLSPLEGQCLQTNVVYQATVTSETSTESYIGLATNFQERYRNHNASFQHTSKKNETELSKHIWTLKDAKKPFKLNGKC